MTAVRTVTLSCDRDNCPATHTVTFDTEVQQRAVREEAHRAGWTRTSTKDFCPEHRSERPATRWAVCPREGCGRRVPVREDGSLRRHRLVVGRSGAGLVLGKTCVDPVTGDVHTRYPDLVVEEESAGVEVGDRSVLTAGQVAVIVLYADGNSFREVGELLGISETAARSRCARAAEALGTNHATHTYAEAKRRGLLDEEEA